MQKLYTLDEAQKICSKMIKNRANELKNDLSKAKNQNLNSYKKEIYYV